MSAFRFIKDAAKNLFFTGKGGVGKTSLSCATAIARKIDEGVDGFVVLDTAPTGHTLLLLDAAESYHREVTRTMSDIPRSVRELLPRLRDPGFTKVFLVALPEATPVHEAAQLQKDLKRAGIEPYAWIINQSMTPLALTDSVLRRRRAEEARFINEVKTLHSDKVALVPWLKDENAVFDWFHSAAPAQSVRKGA